MSEPETITMTEGELEERLEWTAAGAENAVLGGVEATLRTRAGELYAAGKDETAGVVRELARHYERLAKDASRRLQGFINRDAEREQARQ
jgi:hypothetical protein